MTFADHEGYRELRALVEELLTSPPELREGFHAALTVFLALHCRDCGVLLDREVRERSEFCITCYTLPGPGDTSPAARQPAAMQPDPDDIPF